jgi:very-short-patch-repair endonuclease
MARGVLLTDWVARRDGVAHSRDARAAGFSDRDMAEAVHSGALQRVRRSWLVSGGCDTRRRTAAQHGGRVTCVSIAAAHGLWGPDHEDVHVAVPPTRSRAGGPGVVRHWARGPRAVSDTAVEDPPVNALFHVARCLPRRDALIVWESAIRKKVVSPGVLARIEWHSAAARELADVASSLSDSGLETTLTDGLAPTGLPVRQQVHLFGHNVDAVIGERLVVQIDGFEFHQAKDRRRDIAHDAQLVLHGYTVLRFDFVQILFEWETVLETILTAVAQGLHRRR